MKHFYTALIIFIFIISLGFYSNIFLKTKTDILSEKIVMLDINSIDDIATLKTYIENKKNMLQFFMNKEHINDIQLNINLMENRINENNTEKLQELKIETLILLNNIRENLIDFL